ncbi:chloride channel protein [Furfurilactobacillus curtus]|uniref:Chloride channel protein n=1 Tax=Furfurilactobacillus curtus TaxID=1746200 RepID=A0ABQ5JML3_9LACO
MNKQREQGIIAISTLGLGLLIGIGALTLGSFLDLIEHVFLSFEENALYPAAIFISPVHRLISLVLGGGIATILWWYSSVHFKPVVGISDGVAGKRMPIPATLVDVFTQIFYVATGAPVGREVAPRQLGALIAQTWIDGLKKFRHIQVSEDDRQLLIASAAGAGFAGIYIAPITGMLFCVEILLKKVTKRTVVVSLTMSTVAMLMGSLLRGFGPYYLVGRTKFTVASLPVVIILAPLCGITGAYFRQAFQWAGRTRATKQRILWQLPVISLVTGLIAMYFPQIMGNGRALAEAAFHSQTSAMTSLLLVGAVAKAFVTVFTLKSGASGGTLTPSISLGAVLGMLVGFIASLFIPGIQIWQYAVIGAASLLATSQQAPLMALFMVFEVCHLNYSAFLPLGVGISLALATGNFVLKRTRPVTSK